MVKTLRRKFIAITMISVTAVFLIIMGIINIVNYSNVYSNAQARMDILAENNGEFPKTDQPQQISDSMMKPEGMDLSQNNKNSNPQNNLMGQKRDKRDNFNSFSYNGNINEETPFESRYFNITLSENGDYVSSNLDNVAAISSDSAIDYARELYSKGSISGMYNDYMYRQIDVDGGKMYIFLDCKRDLSSFRSFLLISIIVTIAGEILVFILSAILSKIFLKPVFESYDKQKRFITDASHELKTPVAIIKANVEIVEMENGESEWTKSIVKQADRLTNLTEKMVMLSRMDEGNTNEELKDVNASKLFLEICESYEPIAVKMKKTYNVDIEPGLVIRGNETNLSQMLSLLVDNAFKYSNDGGNVDVAFKKTNKGKVLTVSNSVEEIEEGRHDELFERFVRRDESRNSKTGGFGIGLSVVQAIAESYKAKVSARSYDTHSIEFKVIF
ncbi:MAG: HAMP domain-containing histidine kinase [Lachnospiraceae bacterium]|nr:HAMP domain-containing histidine kinase [Lachnospiraceae bacterium]